jgi:hypothetical protein
MRIAAGSRCLTELLLRYEQSRARKPNNPFHYRFPARRSRAGQAEDDDRGSHHGRPRPHSLEPGTGSEVMQRIAVPMIGGMVSSALLTLIVIPAVYGLVKGWQLQPGSAADGAAIKAGPADLKTAAE